MICRPISLLLALTLGVAGAVDYVMIAGHGDELTAAYRRLTGPAPMMPRWALGYIHCRERYKSQAELLENAVEFRARKLPMDVIVQAWQYWGRHGWNAMQFDETLYPNPEIPTWTSPSEHSSAPQA
jgi:alpha-D-xyloside xylohydrolase